MIKEKIKKFKEWLIIKLGGYVSRMEVKTVVNSYTAVPIVHKVSYTTTALDHRLGIDMRYIKDVLYSMARADILPHISKITSETIGDRKEYTLTIRAIQENNDDTISS